MSGTNVEDRWIPSACCMSYSQCSILAHVVDNTLVKIEGNPESAVGAGRLCAKGAAGMMMLYDPNRVNVPLKRTNPEKGIGVDPQWVEITWEEAMDTIVTKLRETQEYNPKALWLQMTTTCAFTGLPGVFMFGNAFGSNTTWVAGGGLHCGHGAHEFGGVMHASWSVVPDWDLCNYAIYWGASKGHAAGHAACINAQGASDARARGMQMVVFDPMCNFAAAKATDWVPIRPGTDGAVALAMANILVNDLGIYDKKYLGRYTNGSYLIQPDGHYYRDKETNKPMVWDEGAGLAKTFDDSSVQEFAIEGNFEVNGVKVQPGFQILKEHLKTYTPELASKASSVPQATIRRIAREFGENARIGSTIVIDGKEFPFRPVASIYFRGAQGHTNSTWTSLAIDLLNHIVGCADVAGGALGFNPRSLGHPESGKPRYEPYPCPDGLMIAQSWMVPHKPYPPVPASAPTSFTLSEIHPYAMMSAFLGSSDQEEWWSAFKFQTRPKMMINFGANGIMSVGNKDVMAEAYKKLDFVVSFDIFLNEMTDFADIVLPDTSYFERLEAQPNFPFIFNHPAGQGKWSWAIRQPVVKPVAQRRDFLRVMYELLDRIDLRAEANIALNVYYNLEGPHALSPDVKYDLDEVWDRVLRMNFGEQHDLEWFKEHGVISWPKKPEEAYWRWSVNARASIYHEWLIKQGEKVKEICIPRDYHLDWKQYEPLITYFPAASHEVKGEEYDLFAFGYRDILHNASATQDVPWLFEVSEMNPFTFNVVMNAQTAKSKGINDLDMVWIENERGDKIQVKMHTVEGIHPRCIAMAHGSSHWLKGHPAEGKSGLLNAILMVEDRHFCPVTQSIETSARVKVYKEAL